MSELKIAAAYIRVSTDDQVEFSPDSQLKKIREYAKAHSLILPDDLIFADEGISGRTAEKRPQFQRMIGLAKTKPKPFDVIIVWKFSRFARNREDSIVYKSLLKKQGIDVVSVSEQLSDDKSSVLMEAIYEAMDEYYSLNLAEEVKRGMREKFSRGGITYNAPFGYKMQDGTFVIDEEKAPIVRMIFNDFISGTPYRQIASKINEMGIKSRHGNTFGNRNIEYILTNHTYTGRVRASKVIDKSDRYHENCETVKADFEAIISDEIFEQAQKKRQEIKKLYKKHDRQTPSEIALRGIVRCSSCGAALVYQKVKDGLQCHNYARGQCKVSHFIGRKKLESVVFSKIAEDLETNSFNFVVEPLIINSEDDNSIIDNLISKEEKKLQRVREAYENGIDSIEEYKENKAKITARIQDLKKQATPKKQKKADITETIRKTIDIINDESSTPAEKNIAIRRIIDSIIFNRTESTIRLIYKPNFSDF